MKGERMSSLSIFVLGDEALIRLMKIQMVEDLAITLPRKLVHKGHLPGGDDLVCAFRQKNARHFTIVALTNQGRR